MLKLGKTYLKCLNFLKNVITGNDSYSLRDSCVGLYSITDAVSLSSVETQISGFRSIVSQNQRMLEILSELQLFNSNKIVQ